MLELIVEVFYGQYGDLNKQYEVPLSRMLNDILLPDQIQWQPSTDKTLYHRRPFNAWWWLLEIPVLQGSQLNFY